MSKPSPQTKPSTLLDFTRLTKSEIDSLRQNKKLISDYVQKELRGSLGLKIAELKKGSRSMDALHNPSRLVLARPRAVCGVAFLANSTRYWPQNAPCIPSRSALHTVALSYAEHPYLTDRWQKKFVRP
jgi:hypothetical protein